MSNARFRNPESGAPAKSRRDQVCLGAFGLALALSGCASTSGGENAEIKEAIAQKAAAAQPASKDARKAMLSADAITQAAFWGQEYDKNPADREAAARYSENLRKIGNADRAALIATQALSMAPDDPILNRAAGLAHTAQGRPHAAIEALSRALKAQPKDPAMLAAMGVALDQIGRTEEARARFKEALSVEPNNALVLTNLGVSYLLSGEAGEAEKHLRKAAAISGAPASARLNLAIALGVQGKFEEAQKYASIDLPPEAAQQNLDYLRSMVTETRRWKGLKTKS